MQAGLSATRPGGWPCQAAGAVAAQCVDELTIAMAGLEPSSCGPLECLGRPRVSKTETHAMTDVTPEQIWETRPEISEQWQRVKIVEVRLDQVEFQYLDAPGTPDIATTVRTTKSAILATTDLWRLVPGVP
jgi:hypothetical protein